jgi:hypothetical protein
MPTSTLALFLLVCHEAVRVEYPTCCATPLLPPPCRVDSGGLHHVLPLPPARGAGSASASAAEQQQQQQQGWMPPSDSPEAAARPQRQPVGGASGRGEEATADNQIELGGPAAVGTAAREAADNQIDYEQGGPVLFCSSLPAAAAAAAADARDAPALLMRQPDANPRLPILTPPAPAISAPIVAADAMRGADAMFYAPEHAATYSVNTDFPQGASCSIAGGSGGIEGPGWLAG